MMKLDNFQGDLTNTSAKKLHWYRMAAEQSHSDNFIGNLQQDAQAQNAKQGCPVVNTSMVKKRAT